MPKIVIDTGHHDEKFCVDAKLVNMCRFLRGFSSCSHFRVKGGFERKLRKVKGTPKRCKECLAADFKVRDND